MGQEVQQFVIPNDTSFASEWNLRNTGQSLAFTDALSASNKVTIPAGTGTVELRLELLSDNYASYSVELLGEDRSTVWRADKLQLRSESGTQFVVARVPARLFPAGDYQLKLRAVNSAGKLEDLPSYSFRVVR